MRFLSPILAIVLTPLLAVLPMSGQIPAAPLEMHVIANGDGATALAGTRLAQPLAVEVRDNAGTPVANAAVIFRLPDSGPSGTFADGTRASVVYTDAAGRASAADIQWGNAPGAVAMRITAAKGDGHAGVLYTETLTGAVAAAPKPLPMSQAPAKPGVLASSGAAIPEVTIERVGSGAHQAHPAVAEVAEDDDSPDANIPIRHTLGGQTADADAAGVSVTRVGAGEASVSGGHHLKRWILVAAVVAAGAGAGLALVRKGSGSTSSGITIGNPTISVGHP